MIYIFLSIIIFLTILILDILRLNIILSKVTSFNIKNLVKAVSISSIIGIFLPFRINDFLAILYLNKKERNLSFYLIFSSYFLIRLIDFILILLIFFLFYKFFNTSISAVVIIPFLIIIGMICLILVKERLSFLIFKLSSYFNKNIQLFILKIIWTIWNITKLINITSFIKITLASFTIWFLNLISIVILFQINSTTFNFYKLNEIFKKKYIEGFSKSKIYNFEDILLSLNNNVLFYEIFFIPFSIFVSAILLIILVNTLKLKNFKTELNQSHNLFSNLNENNLNNIILQNFKTGSSKQMLTDYDFIYKLNILKKFQGKSGADVYLLKENDKIYFKKFSNNPKISKSLINQFNWLNDNKSILPLTNVSNLRKSNYAVAYDMSATNKFQKFSNLIHECDNKAILSFIDNFFTKIPLLSNDQIFFDKDSYDIKGWTTTDVYLNTVETKLLDIETKKMIDKKLFRVQNYIN